MNQTPGSDARTLYRVTFQAIDSAETYSYEADAHPLRSPRTVAFQLWHLHCQRGLPEIDLLSPVIENLGPIAGGEGSG